MTIIGLVKNCLQHDCKPNKTKIKFFYKCFQRSISYTLNDYLI